MANNEIDTLVKKMYCRLFQRTSVSAADGGWVRVSLPFLNRINDCIEMYFRVDDGYVDFSDGGDAVDLFLLGGHSLDDARKIASMYGFDICGGVNDISPELFHRAPVDSFSDTMMDFIDAVMSLSK